MYCVFSEPCVRVSGRRDGRRDAGASQGRLDAPGREHKAPVGRVGRAPLRRQRTSTMLQHRLRRGSWRGRPSSSLKIRNTLRAGLSGKVAPKSAAHRHQPGHSGVLRSGKRFLVSRSSPSGYHPNRFWESSGSSRFMKFGLREVGSILRHHITGSAQKKPMGSIDK